MDGRIQAVVLCGLATLATAANDLAPDGVVRDWIVLGPFPSRAREALAADGVDRDGFETDFLQPLGGEAKAAIDADTAVRWVAPDGQETLSRAARPQAIGSGHQLHRPFDGQVGYAFTRLRSDSRQTAWIYFASNGSPKVWLNGELILRRWKSHHQHRAWMYGVKVTLDKGDNRLLVKLDNARGWWGFDMTVLTEANHRTVAMKAVESLTVGEWAAGGRTIALTPQTVPALQDISLPVRVEMLDEQGSRLAEATGKTGERMFLPKPEADRVVQIRLQTRDDAGKDLSGQKRKYTGDYPARVRTSGRLLSEAAGDLSWLNAPWRAPTAATIAWLARWKPVEPDDPTDQDLNNLAYQIALGSALKARRNFLAANPTGRFPCWFEGDGVSYEYLLQLPRDFGSSDQRSMLVINLHGSGGIRWDFDYSGTLRDTPPETAEEGAIDHIQVRPHSLGGWQSRSLNALLDRLLADLPIDPDRVCLTGHSMGGHGTWLWAMDSPQRFAAIAPLAGAENPVRAARLRHVPVWAFQGELDAAVAPWRIERCVVAAQEAGAVVRYSLFSDAPHGMGDRVPYDELSAWFAAQRRSKQSPPADPVAAIKLSDGVSNVELREIPQGTWLITQETLEPGRWQRMLSDPMGRLYQAYRTTGRLARGDVRVFAEIESLGRGATEMRLWSAIPVDPRNPSVKASPAPAHRVLNATVCEWEKLPAAVEKLRKEAAARKLTPRAQPRVVIYHLGREAPLLGVEIEVE